MRKKWFINIGQSWRQREGIFKNNLMTKFFVNAGMSQERFLIILRPYDSMEFNPIEFFKVLKFGLDLILFCLFFCINVFVWSWVYDLVWVVALKRKIKKKIFESFNFPSNVWAQFRRIIYHPQVKRILFFRFFFFSI